MSPSIENEIKYKNELIVTLENSNMNLNLEINKLNKEIEYWKSKYNIIKNKFDYESDKELKEDSKVSSNCDKHDDSIKLVGYKQNINSLVNKRRPSSAKNRDKSNDKNINNKELKSNKDIINNSVKRNNNGIDKKNAKITSNINKIKNNNVTNNKNKNRIIKTNINKNQIIDNDE